jgi:hypothetical protein
MRQRSHERDRPRPAPPQDVSSGRTYFRDVKPYEAPARLDDLRGPTGGSVAVPHSIL